MDKKDSPPPKRRLYGIVSKTQKRIRKEIVDYDYIDKLNYEEAEWLDRFSREFNGADFKHEGAIVNKTKKQRKTCTDRNNSRNRDQYALAMARDKLDAIEDFREADRVKETVEDELIAAIDRSHWPRKPIKSE